MPIMWKLSGHWISPWAAWISTPCSATLWRRSTNYRKLVLGSVPIPPAVLNPFWPNWKSPFAAVSTRQRPTAWCRVTAPKTVKHPPGARTPARIAPLGYTCRDAHDCRFTTRRWLCRRRAPVFGRTDFPVGEVAQPLLLDCRTAQRRPAGVLVPRLRRARGGRYPDSGRALESRHGQVDGAVHPGRYAGLPGNQPGPLSGFAAAPLPAVAPDRRPQVGDRAHEVPHLHRLPAVLRSAEMGVPGQYRAGAERHRGADQGLCRRRCRGSRSARRTGQAADRKGGGRILLPHGLVHPDASAGTAFGPDPGAHVFRRLFVRHHGDL